MGFYVVQCIAQSDAPDIMDCCVSLVFSVGGVLSGGCSQWYLAHTQARIRWLVT